MARVKSHRARTKEPYGSAERDYLCFKNTAATSTGLSIAKGVAYRLLRTFVSPHEQNFVAREFPDFSSYLLHLLLLLPQSQAQRSEERRDKSDFIQNVTTGDRGVYRPQVFCSRTPEQIAGP